MDKIKKQNIFVINLDTDVDKKNRMQTTLEELGISFEFFNAIDGRLLTKAQINKVYDEQKVINTINRSLHKTEIGCALSHFMIYKMMLSTGIEEAVILEDDVVISKDFVQIIKLFYQLPKDWDWVLLGSGHPNDRAQCYVDCKKNILRFIIGKPFYNYGGTYGYCINDKGARKILNKTNKIFMPIDMYTNDYKIVNL